MRNVNPVILVVLLTVLMIGCTNSSDDRLVQMAQEHEKCQAAQSQQMARMQQEVAEGSKKLVEADAKARVELAALQHALRGDQAAVGRQRDQLEAERRGIATQRNRDPIVAAAITNTGLALVCLLPLLVCGYMLWCVGHSRDSDAAVTELLIEELVTDQPRLLPLSPPLSPPLPILMHQRSEVMQADGSLD